MNPFPGVIAKHIVPKVETGLLQIDPAHVWNFSQTFFEKIKTNK